MKNHLMVAAWYPTRKTRLHVMIYLNVTGRLGDAIATVGPNGGEVLQDKHQIGPFGFRAIIVDSEGNRVALHAETIST